MCLLEQDLEYFLKQQYSNIDHHDNSFCDRRFVAIIMINCKIYLYFVLYNFYINEIFK